MKERLLITGVRFSRTHLALALKDRLRSASRPKQQAEFFLRAFCGVRCIPMDVAISSRCGWILRVQAGSGRARRRHQVRRPLRAPADGMRGRQRHWFTECRARGRAARNQEGGGVSTDKARLRFVIFTAFEVHDGTHVLRDDPKARRVSRACVMATWPGRQDPSCRSGPSSSRRPSFAFDGTGYDRFFFTVDEAFSLSSLAWTIWMSFMARCFRAG